MQTIITIAQTTDTLRALPAEKLAVVYDFVLYISKREIKAALNEPVAKSSDFMSASEVVLCRDWARPEEDAARANL